MLSLFIAIIDIGGNFTTIIQCSAWRWWCEIYPISNFRYLLAAGAMECFFEIVGIVKIYRRKNITEETKNDGRE